MLSVCLALLGAEAGACSPPPPLSIEFTDDSSDLRADTLSSMSSALGGLRQHGPKCASFAIYAYSRDESGPSRRLAEDRADKSKSALINFGAKPDLIKTFVRSEVGRRQAELANYGVSGRTYCDPTSKNAAYVDGANCQPQYTQCYVKLEDGTICNYDAVPDPNPVRYSVTP